MRVLVTGADGFVGRHACALLEHGGDRVRRAVRRAEGPGADRAVVGDIGPRTDWSAALDGIDTVVHLAARVHVMRDASADPEAEYRRVNVEGTASLAAAAARSGVRRVVFMSSVKVNGERTAPGEMFSAADPAAPRDAYGRSKEEAERILHGEGSFETVVIRPPLVYGPGVGANFLRLLRTVARGYPLPFAAVHNARSLVFVGNLGDAVRACCSHPQAAGKTFLVSDAGAPPSTPDLVRALASALGRPARLFAAPPSVLRGAALLLGRGGAADRVLESLVVDSAPITRVLGWTPRYSLAQGLQETVAWYRQIS